MPPLRTIKVFMASPNDLAVERRVFKETLEEMNKGVGRGVGAVFEVLGWEGALAATGRRPQGVINRDVDECDVFFLVMHRRWGQHAPDAAPHTSYTEEEFFRAYNRWRETGTPEVFVFFKEVDPGQLADPGPQLQQVLAFRKKLQDSGEVLYKYFADEAAFRAEVERHLCAFARGELSPAVPGGAGASGLGITPSLATAAPPRPAPAAAAPASPALTFPKHPGTGAAAGVGGVGGTTPLAVPGWAPAGSAGGTGEVRGAPGAAGNPGVDALAYSRAEQGAAAAREGRFAEARQLFAEAIESTTDIRVLQLASEFFQRTGDLVQAEAMLTRSLAITGPDEPTIATANAHGSLAALYQVRGRLAEAEASLRKALAIHQKHGHWVAVATDYAALGRVYFDLQRLKDAAEMHGKALDFFKKSGMLAGVAATYVNLGAVHQARGEHGDAERFLDQALALYTRLGSQEGLMNAHTSLGMLHFARGDFKKSEESHRLALTIAEGLGLKLAVAIASYNVGSARQHQGDTDGARRYYRQSYELHAQVGASPLAAQARASLEALGPE